MKGIREMLLIKRQLKRYEEHKKQLLIDYKECKKKLLIEFTKITILRWVINSKQRCYNRNNERYSFWENDLALCDIGWLDTELCDYEWDADMYREEFLLLLEWL